MEKKFVMKKQFGLSFEIEKNNQVTISHKEIIWKLNVVEFYFQTLYSNIFDNTNKKKVLEFILDYVKNENKSSKKYKPWGVNYLIQMDLEFIWCHYRNLDPEKKDYKLNRNVNIQDLIDCYDGTLVTYLYWKRDARIKNKVRQTKAKKTQTTEKKEMKDTLEPNFEDVRGKEPPLGYDYPHYVPVENVIKKAMAADYNTYIVDWAGHIFNVHPPVDQTYNPKEKKLEKIPLSYPCRWQIMKWDFDQLPDEIKDFFDPNKSDDFFDLD